MQSLEQNLQKDASIIGIDMHVVRRVFPHEYKKYKDHLKSLDFESRVMRFGFPVKDEVIDTLCEGIEKNYKDHVLFCVEDCQLNFIGVGHVSTQGEMELAFSVHQDYRKQGIGSALINRVVQYCKTRGLLKGQMVCLSTNTAIKRLCVKHGIKLESEHGETYGYINLDIPNIDTYLEENNSANLAVTDYFVKRAVNFWSISPN